MSGDWSIEKTVKIFRQKVLIDCHKCEYYFVTWDKNFPHGCRGMDFKSRQIPGIVVRKSNSGRDCLLFKVKKNYKAVEKK